MALPEIISARTANCVVIGLGYIGTELMRSLVCAGYKPHGYDRNAAVVGTFVSTTQKDLDPTSYTVSDSNSNLSDADIILIAVRVLPRADGTLNLEPLKSVASMINMLPIKQRLILIESTVEPGTTRIFAQDWLKQNTASASHIGYSPERLQTGNRKWTFKNTPHVFGGLDSHSTELATLFFDTICDVPVPVSKPEVAELSKLLENVFMNVSISLIGEITRLSHAMGISAREVTEAAATKPFGYFPFHPGAGIGGHCLPNDIEILKHTFKRLGLTAPMLETTTTISKCLPKITVQFLSSIATSKSETLDNKSILVIGVGFKTGSPDTTETPATGIIQELRQHNALVYYADSQVETFRVEDQLVKRLPSKEYGARKFFACLLLAGDPDLTGNQLSRMSDIIIDVNGIGNRLSPKPDNMVSL